jgi:hypothetical protein
LKRDANQRRKYLLTQIRGANNIDEKWLMRNQNNADLTRTRWMRRCSVEISPLPENLVELGLRLDGHGTHLGGGRTAEGTN